MFLMQPTSPAPMSLPVQHDEFDAHYLRKFAHALPFHFCPQLERTPFTVDCFIDDFYARLTPVLEGQGKRELLRLLLERTIVRKHIGFTFLARFVHLHTGQERLDDSLAYVRHDLQRIMHAGVLSLPSPDHPLWANCRARHALTSHDVPMRVIDATTKDKQIASQMKDLPLETVLPTVGPEYLSLDPVCKILHASSILRSRMREKLMSTFDGTEEARDALIHDIIDEWLQTRSSQVGRTSDGARNAHALDALIEGLQAELNIPDITAAPPQHVINVLLPVLKRDRATFCRYAPLLEQFLMHLARCREVESLAIITNDIQTMIRWHCVNLCDFPGLALAILALRTRFYDQKEIISALQ